MSQDFIDTVRAIVMSNIADEKFGVRKLGSILGLSSSQTLRKVKSSTGKSVNQYIRELRLEKAAKLIKKTDFTIAEISYQVGFRYPSYFNKTFCKYYGISPGEYKTRSFTLSELAAKKTAKEPKTNFTEKKVLYIVSLVLVVLIGYFLINKMFSKDTKLPNSIAVLPFKDLSPENSQWFSDGVSDNILHSLSQMKDLSVISFTSSSTFKGSNKQISEIAKELGVSYILEGSVTLVDDKIKIIAQLIDSNNEHVWSKEYDENFENVIAIQKNVARDLTKQLEITLSPSEVITLNKYPTQNMEAYYLYLKGRTLQKTREKKDLISSIELFKKAINLDSNFNEAYGEVASSYSLLSELISPNINRSKARENAEHYADMALAIDPNTVYALTTKANLLSYVDFDKSDQYFKRAIAINPNNSQARMQFGLGFIVRPEIDRKKYLEELELAYQLAPLSYIANGNYFNALINCRKLDEAEALLQKSRFVFSESIVISHQQKIKACRDKDWTFLKPYYEKRIEENPDDPVKYIDLAIYYRDYPYDYVKNIELCKQAYLIDSAYIGVYVYALIKKSKFKEAKELMSSATYKANITKEAQLSDLWFFNYEKNNIKKALEILNDSVYKNRYWEHTLTYAKAGNRKKVDSMNKRYPWGDGVFTRWRMKKAILHAALKDRDSMYFYLENYQYLSKATLVNEYGKEFDPYRNEDRFKAFLKKKYLPVPGE